MSGEPYPSLPHMLEEMPAPDEPITDGRPYLSEEAAGEFVVQGVNYLPPMQRIWATFRQCSFPENGQCDYMEWSRRYLAEQGAKDFTPEMVARMRHPDCLYLLRLIQRSERFCDGAWAAAFRAGLFHAIARRLMELAGGDKRSEASRHEVNS